MLGFSYRNITMLINVSDGMVTASFKHPTRFPTFEEMRVLIERILPSKNLYIPVSLHTFESHMVTAIELPAEIKKGTSEDVRADIESKTEVSTDRA